MIGVVVEVVLRRRFVGVWFWGVWKGGLRLGKRRVLRGVWMCGLGFGCCDVTFSGVLLWGGVMAVEIWRQDEGLGFYASLKRYCEMVNLNFSLKKKNLKIGLQDG